MGSSPTTLVAPGLRTAARTGWRGSVAGALHVVASQPALWLLGALGFLVRGGAILLTLAILVLPSPVSVRLMLGSYLGSFGLTPEFWLALAVGLALLGAGVVLALVVSAAVEIAAFERFVAAEPAPLSDAPVASRLTPAARRRLLAALVGVQLVGVALLAAAAVPIVVTAVGATYEELVRPSLAGGALYGRVLSKLGEPLFGWLVVLVVVEMVGAAASRRLLARSLGLAGGGAGAGLERWRSVFVAVPVAIGAGLMRPIRRPLSTLPTALLGWLATFAVLAPLGWLLALAWEATRVQYLGGASLVAVPGLLLVAALLCVVWLGGVAMAGFASAVRCALWTSEELR
ncbi:hypothetical protein BH23CHL7_BH23CHL7_13750 [soil metagenome]